MLESGGVWFEGRGLHFHFSGDVPPFGHGLIDFAQNGQRIRLLQSESGCHCESARDGGLTLIFADGRLPSAYALHFRDRINIVGRRKRPPASLAHQEAVISKMVVVVAGQQRENKSPP